MTGLDFLKLTLENLRPYLIKGSIDEQTAVLLKSNLDKAITFISSPIFEIGFPEIQRVTINRNLFDGQNKRIDDIDLLKYPPAEVVKKHGRANKIGQSILYAKFNHVTALNEMKPKVGDLITVSTWTLPDYINLSVSPIFKITSKDNLTHNELSLHFLNGYNNSLKQHPKEDAEQIDELIQFIAECFAKDVDYGNNYDYFMSVYFANKIFTELEGDNVDAIVYPSVADKLNLSNIAIKPNVFDKKYKLKEVNESVVRATPRENGIGYALDGTGWTKKFDNNKILW